MTCATRLAWIPFLVMACAAQESQRQKDDLPASGDAAASPASGDGPGASSGPETRRDDVSDAAPASSAPLADAGPVANVDSGRAPPGGEAPTPLPSAGGGPASVAEFEVGDPCKDITIPEAQGTIGGVPFDFWVPGGVASLRCIIGGASDKRPLARLHHCAVMRIPGEPSPTGAVLGEALKNFARLTGHPEVEHLQVIGAGYSKGYGEMGKLAGAVPERFLAVFGGGIHTLYPKGLAMRVPWLSFNGSADIAYIDKSLIEAGSNHPWWANNVAIVRAQGALFGHAVRWGAPHQEGDSKHLMFAFYHQIIARRAPPKGAAITQLAPRALDQSTGWLVSTSDWNTVFPTLAAYSDWTGDRTKASWVADAYTAHVLRAYTAKGSPVQITNPVCKGDRCVPRSAGVKTAIPVTVEVAGPAPAHVELWDGDRPLFKMTRPPYVFPLSEHTPGVHAFIAHAVFADGRRAVSKPSTIIVDRPGSNCAKPPAPAP